MGAAFQQVACPHARSLAGRVLLDRAAASDPGSGRRIFAGMLVRGSVRGSRAARLIPGVGCRLLAQEPGPG